MSSPGSQQVGQAIQYPNPLPTARSRIKKGPLLCCGLLSLHGHSLTIQIIQFETRHTCSLCLPTAHKVVQGKAWIQFNN